MEYDKKETILWGIFIFLIILIISIIIKTFNFVINNQIDLSIIANFLVAIATMILAFFTFQSVKASESGVAIANRALSIQQLAFTKAQIVDHINNFFLPLADELTSEIMHLSKLEIGYKMYNVDSLIPFKNNAFLDFWQANYFDEIDSKNCQNPTIISLKKIFPEIFILLMKRHEIHLECKNEILNFISIIQKYDKQITNYIDENYFKTVKPIENGNEIIEVDFIVLSEYDPDNELLNKTIEINFSAFKESLRSLLICDIFTPIETITSPPNTDLKGIYIRSKKNLQKIFKENEIDLFYEKIDHQVTELLIVNNKIKETADKIKEDYIINYGLTSKDFPIKKE